jgi:hypothetical protein
MDLEKVVAALIRERELLDQAISHLEKLSMRPGDSQLAQQSPSRGPARHHSAGAASD